MAAGDDDRVSTIKHIAFIMGIFAKGCLVRWMYSIHIGKSVSMTPWHENGLGFHMVFAFGHLSGWTNQLAG